MSPKGIDFAGVVRRHAPLCPARAAILVALATLGPVPARAAIFGVPTNLNADGTVSANSANPPGWLVLERQNSGSANGDVVKQMRFFIEVTGTSLDVRVFDAGMSGARDLGNVANTRYTLYDPAGAQLGGGAISVGADSAAVTENRLARFACVQAGTPAFRVPNAGLGTNTHRIWGTGTAAPCLPLPPGLYVFEISIQSNATTEGRNAFGVEFLDSSGTPYNAYTIGSADNTIAAPAATDTSMIVGAVAGESPVAATSGPAVFYPFVDRGCSVEASSFDLDADTPDGNGSVATMTDVLGLSTSLARSNDDDTASTTVVVEPAAAPNTESLNYGMFALLTVLDDAATPLNHVDWRVADFQGSIAGVPANLPRRPTSPIRTYLPNGYSGCGLSGCAMVPPAEPVLLSSTRVVSGENPPLPGGGATRLLLTSTVYNQSTLPLTGVQITVPIPTGGTLVTGSEVATIEGTPTTCSALTGGTYRRCTFATSLPGGQVASLNIEVDYQPPGTGVQVLSGAPAAGSPPPNTTLWARYTPPWSSGTFARTETLGPLCPLAVVAAPAADVRITKTGPATVTGGAVLTQTIQVQNLTATAAPSPSFTDPLPSGTTFLSIAPAAGWTCATPPVGSGGTVACSASSLAASATASFTLNLGISSLLPNGTVLANTATAFSGAADPNLANNSATASTTVVAPAAQADLAVTQTDTPDPVTPGLNIVYAITVHNMGPATAIDGSLADTVPASTTFVALSSPAGWTCSTPAVGGTGPVSCAVPTLAAGRTATFLLQVRVNPAVPAGTTITNTAQVSNAVADPVAGNNSATATTTVAAPSLVCPTPGKDGTPAGPLAGSANTYYPGQATAANGATSLALGPARGAPQIAAGDLVLVMQMQDATIDASDSDAYGDGFGGDGVGSGATLLNNSGRYEYALATSGVPLGGGTLTVSSGLLNTYTATLAVTALTSAGPTATATTAVAHGFANGAAVTIGGATPAGFNGTFLIRNVTATTFQYTLAGPLASPATGTITANPATGTTLAVTSLTRFFFTATATTATPHGLATGATVLIAGAIAADLNGAFTVTVTGATTFTYTVPFGFGADAGTITATTFAPSGLHRYQVIRVPQYLSATLGSTLSALAWNGGTGGVLVLDVQDALALGGATLSVSGRGFRGGGARQLGGGPGGSGTAFVSLSTSPFHSSKAEGIAGTPRYVYDAFLPGPVNVLDTGDEGYPNGSFARGAPGNAGGGGSDSNPSANDENSGGGGGGNGGQGGRGGNAWNSNAPVGGFGGAAVPAGPPLLVLGGGGGSGTRNNSTGDQSSGAAGGGIVLVRAGSLTGTGTIEADGATANILDTIPANDSGGGGGAGGSVVVLAPGGGLGGLTVHARGGRGSDAWPGQVAGSYPGERHGPGGGGGGGVVILSGPPASADVSGGTSGTTNTTSVPETFGAQDGSIGVVIQNLEASQIPGIETSGICGAPAGIVDLAVTVTGPSGTVEACGSASYTFEVRNDGPDTAPGSVVSFPTDVNTSFQSLSEPAGWSCVTPAPGGKGASTCTRPTFAAGASSTFVLVVRVDCGTPVGTVFLASASISSSSTETFPPNNSASQPSLVGPAVQLLTRAAIRGLRVDPGGRQVDFATGWQRGTAGFNVYATDDPTGTSGLDLLTPDPVRAPVPDSTTPILYTVQTRPIREGYLLLEEIERGGARRLAGPFRVGDAHLAAIQGSLERRLALAGTVESSRAQGGRARMVPPPRRRQLRALADPRHAARSPADSPGAGTSTERGRAPDGPRSLARQREGESPSRGVKIEVAEAGRVVVTQSELEAAGLPPGTPLGRARLYTQGRRVGFEIGRADGEPAVVFQGEPLLTTYSSVGVYVLAWERVPPMAVPLSREGDPARAGWTRVERSPVWVANVPPGTDPWLWDILLGDGGPWPYDWWDPSAGDFDLPGLRRPPATPVPVRIRVQGVSAHRHMVDAFINGQPVGSVTFDNQSAGYIEGYASGLQREGNRLSLEYRTELGDPEGYAYLDYLELQLPRPLRPPRAVFSLAPYDPALPRMGSLDYLIVTHPDFRPAAERLAALRRAEGFQAGVVDVERAYDRLSGGFVEADAVRELVRIARTGGRLRYVLLLGDDSFDPDDRTGLGVRTFVPSLFGWDDGFGRIASENLYADTNGDGSPDVAIGRLPAQTPEEAESLVTRVADRRALLTGEWGHVIANDNQTPGEVNFRAEADLFAARVPAGVRVERADVGQGVARARADFVAALGHGPSLVHYWGHGGPEQLADESLVAVEDVPGLATGPGVLVTWTCLAQFYQYAFGPSLDEAFLLDEASGIRASLGPAGISAAAVQSLLSTRFYDELEGGAVPLGDAVRRAKARALAEDPRSRPAVTGFNLLGDPSLLVPGLDAGLATP